jgi:hypothetical protein
VTPDDVILSGLSPVCEKSEVTEISPATYKYMTDGRLFFQQNLADNVDSRGILSLVASFWSQ